jgi:gliding motility-associated-like protein
LGTSTTAKYLDQTYATAPGYCYKINYVDECNNKSNDSDIACPIQLLGTLNDRNEITLIWTDYTGWTLGVKNYVVEKYDKNGIQIKSYTTGTLTTLIDDLADPKNQIVGYRIVAMPNETTLVSSVSNLVNFTKEVNLFYPTSFTPDKQGPVENEVFNVNGQFIVKLELSIFDRWGAQIFYSSKNEPWDGTQGGQPMPIASYVWTANITDLAGRSLKRSGTVVLLRK